MLRQQQKKHKIREKKKMEIEKIEERRKKRQNFNPKNCANICVRKTKNINTFLVELFFSF